MAVQHSHPRRPPTRQKPKGICLLIAGNYWQDTIFLYTMAGYSIFRFFRFLRSMCAPLTACIGFSCLLTFIFILYQPTAGPGNIQRLGWQSWDIISPTNATVDESTHPGADSNATVPGSVDWWNVTAPADQTVDSASLPLDVWAPLLPHDTGRAL